MPGFFKSLDAVLAMSRRENLNVEFFRQAARLLRAVAVGLEVGEDLGLQLVCGHKGELSAAAERARRTGPAAVGPASGPRDFQRF